MKTIMKCFVGLCLLAILGYYGFTFTVREGEGAIVTRFGKISQVCTQSGLYGRLPWPFDQVIAIDMRVQMLDSGYTETLTHDKRNIILQTYMAWEIIDPTLFYKSIGTMAQAQSYLNDLLANAKNGVMGHYNLSALVNTDPTKIELESIESELMEQVAPKALVHYGLQVNALKVKRLALPAANVPSVYEQMRADRQKAVTTLTSEGERDAQIIRSNADAEVAKILSEAQTEAADIQASTEKQVSTLYAQAYQKNPSLFTTLQRLAALEASANENTVMVLESDESPFAVLFPQLQEEP